MRSATSAVARSLVSPESWLCSTARLTQRIVQIGSTVTLGGRGGSVHPARNVAETATATRRSERAPIAPGRRRSRGSSSLPALSDGRRERTGAACESRPSASSSFACTRSESPKPPAGLRDLGSPRLQLRQHPEDVATRVARRLLEGASRTHPTEPYPSPARPLPHGVRRRGARPARRRAVVGCAAARRGGEPIARGGTPEGWLAPGSWA